METLLKVGLFENHMEIQNIEIMRAHRTNVKQRGAMANGVENARPIHVYLLRYTNKVRILKVAARTLKDNQFHDCQIFISDDVSKTVRKERAKLRKDYLKEIKDREAVEFAFIPWSVPVQILYKVYCKGRLSIPRKYVINAIDEIQSEFSLHDIWRLKNPTTQSFTWARCSPFVFCRLDYWLISDKLHDLVSKVDIIPSIKTDHSAIILEIEEIRACGRGPGFWKLNTSLLSDENYKTMINNKLPTWLEEGKGLDDPRSIWDWIKFNIRSNSIIFSKQIASIRRKQEEELNQKYQASLSAFQINPCDNTRVTMERCKRDLELLYEDKVEGIILRARARWHEHGEKNSKYFLNLEKRNHIKKHIRKLHISGVISTDPFKIMDSQRQFYSNLYKSKNVNLESVESTFFFDNPLLPKLSSDSRENCEGRITADECQNVLNTFATGKTPGNDGIPIEFYKTFWPLLGEILVKAFNEAFVKKEMSTSQRQAIITLVEKKDKDRTYLENWRPISLINVDAKIASVL